MMGWRLSKGKKTKRKISRRQYAVRDDEAGGGDSRTRVRDMDQQIYPGRRGLKIEVTSSVGEDRVTGSRGVVDGQVHNDVKTGH